MGKVGLKHKILLDKMKGKDGKPKSLAAAAREAGYSENYINSGKLTNTDSWQKLMAKYLPDSLLSRVHHEGLVATTEENIPDHSVRHKYLDSAYKLKGKYAEQKIAITNLNELLSAIEQD